MTAIPEWLTNLVSLCWRVVVVVGLAILVFYVVSRLWTVTASIAVAIVISAVFAPYVRTLESRGRTRTAAAGIVWAAAIGLVAIVLLVIGLAFLPYVINLVTSIHAGTADLQSRLSAANAPPALVTAVSALVNVPLNAVSDAVGTALGSIAGIVTVLILAAFLVFFFLRDGDSAWRWLLQAASEPKQARITAAGGDALERVGGYLRGTTFLGLITATSTLVFLLLLGVPFAGPLAVLVFLCGYIPYFGTVIATGGILLITLAAVGPLAALVLLALIVAQNVILGRKVRPAVHSDTISLHPAVVLLALLAGFEIAGVVGVFAAVPMTVIVLAVASTAVAVIDPRPEAKLPGIVPAWLDEMAQWGWRILVASAGIAILIGGVSLVPLVAIPIALGIILAATFAPIVEALMHRGHSRARAAAISIGGGTVIIAVIIFLAIVALVDQADQIAKTTADGATAADGALGGQAGLLSTAISQGSGALLGSVRTGFSDVAAVLVIAAVSLLLAYYLVRDAAHLPDRLLARVQPDVASQVRGAGTQAVEILGGYMFGTAAISLVGAASQLVIMVLLGLPLALPVFVLSFFLCFIPYIGGFISTGIALLITIAVGSPLDILIMVGWTLVFNIVTGNIVAPLVYGRTVHIHPAIALLAIPAAAAVGGILGMFLVIPILGVVATTWRTVLALLSRGDGGPTMSSGTLPSEALRESTAGLGGPLPTEVAPAG